MYGRSCARLLPQAHIEEVGEADPGALQAFRHDRRVRLQVGRVHPDGLFRFSRIKLLVTCFVDTLAAGPNAVPDRHPARDVEGLIRPLLDWRLSPACAIAVGDFVEQFVPYLARPVTEFALDDAGVPYAVEVVEARAGLLDLPASPVILKRHVQRLVKVADPVAEELQRIELSLVIGRRSQDL
jgi:hypothetical protein